MEFSCIDCGRPLEKKPPGRSGKQRTLCAECYQKRQNAQKAVWRKAHPEQMRGYTAKYQRTHPEQMRENTQRFQHSEKGKAWARRYHLAWQKNNKARYNELQRFYYHRRNQRSSE